MVDPPRRASEIERWIAANAADPKCFETLAWAPGRTAAVHAACVRALARIGGEGALTALATYPGRPYGDKIDFGDIWDCFDRWEFARRVLVSGMHLGGGRGLARLDGIQAIRRLSHLSIRTADACSLAPLGECTRLISLTLHALGDLDPSPIARLPILQRLDIRQGRALTSLSGLEGTVATTVDLEIPTAADLDFLETMPRLERATLRSARVELTVPERDVLRRLVAKGVALRAYVHEPWSIALADTGGVFREVHGFRYAAQDTPAMYGFG